MKETIDLVKLSKRLLEIRQGYWNFQEGLIDNSYKTSLEDKFDVSLSLHHEDEPKKADGSNYKLLISLKYNFKHNTHVMTFSGKDVKNLYNIIDGRYKKYIEKLKKEDDCSFIESLNEFLNKNNFNP